MSTVSFASPPIAPQQRHTHPSAVPLHPFLIAQRRFTPLRPSPLSPHAPSSPRGRSSHFPHARPRAPLSRRYTRPLAESYLTSRAPVQVGSVPRFSTPLPFFSSNPPDTQQRLFESLVFLILTRRLAEKLQKMAMHQLGERAGLGGLRAGREMLIWAACVRMRREEERRERAPFCVIVPPLERPGLAHAGGAGGSPSARPLEGLPALEALVRPQEGVLAQRERGKRGHSRGYSMPVSPPLTPPPTPPPEVPSKPSHKRRLSSLTLPSLPSLRRSTSTPAPSPPPTALFTFDRPSLPRRSHSELGPSSGYGFAKSAEGDLPLSLRTLLPRSVERAVLRPAPTSSSPPPSPPLPPPASSEGFYPPSPSPFALDPFARRASLPLPATPRQIPLAPESMQRILPSGLVIFTSAAGSEGGRSGRGLEDWMGAQDALVAHYPPLEFSDERKYYEGDNLLMWI
ncbi:hypothetical protein JCM10213_002770 [Rhodosporidiobolus nylandii]